MRALVVGNGSAGKRHLSLIRQLLGDDGHLLIPSRDFMGSLQENSVPGLSAPVASRFDFAVVASPAPFHLRHLRLLAEAGLPVLVEKPLAGSYEEVEENWEWLVADAPKIQVAYLLRYSQAFGFFRDCIASKGPKGLAQVSVVAHSYLPNWRNDRHYSSSVSAKAELGGGALLELSHEFDYLLNLFGTVRQTAVTLRKSEVLGLDVETSAHVHALLKGQARVCVSLDIESELERRTCRVEWKNGHVVSWDILGNSVSILSGEEVLGSKKFVDSREDWFIAQLHDFLGVVTGVKDARGSVEAARDVLELIRDIRRGNFE
jgi:predicted dehydrogenase